MAKPVALVIGASRGIGRQVAIDLAKNGYSGSPQSASMTLIQDRANDDSRRRRQIHVLRQQDRPLPPRSQLAAIDHQHGRARDPRGRRRGHRHPRRHALRRPDQLVGGRDGAHLRHARRARLQLRRHLVGRRREHARQALPADAEDQPGGPVCRGAGSPAVLWPEWLEGPDYRRVSADLFPVFPGEDGVCDG